MDSSAPRGGPSGCSCPAAFVTALGNNVQLIAGALLMIRNDKTMLSVGLLFIAVAVPQAVLSPYFGRLADRHDRRRLWIGCDLTSAVLALALPVWLALGGAKAPGVYAANFALAVVAALFFPVSNAMIKERVRASGGAAVQRQLRDGHAGRDAALGDRRRVAGAADRGGAVVGVQRGDVRGVGASGHGGRAGGRRRSWRTLRSRPTRLPGPRMTSWVPFAAPGRRFRRVVGFRSDG